MPKALVTGGAGFLGSHLCDKLLARGFEVVAMDNMVTGNPKNLAHLEGNSAFTFVQHDITEEIPWSGPLDRLFNMASPASPIDYLQIPLETLAVGSIGTRNCLELAKNTGARFLMASTSECYGDPLVHPQVEDYWGNVNPIGPRSCYDEAKRFSEAITMAYFRTHGVKTRIVRIFNTYGPRMRLNDGRVVPSLMRSALRGEALSIFGDGSQTRSFCYVDDLLEGIQRLMESEEHLPTNIGNPVEMSILEFAEAVNQVVGSTFPIEFGPLPENDPKVRRPDITKAKALLDWEPSIALKEGLEKSLDYFKQCVAEEGQA
ncbi:MAG: SDR family oxidoreductase [Planctomycetota bacterium]|nr:SDR family oxidoreductase [Planctomycetota bacterium]MDA1114744.1 SDR family oxidoreductase [Planctomycetota bacterium]